MNILYSFNFLSYFESHCLSTYPVPFSSRSHAVCISYLIYLLTQLLNWLSIFISIFLNIRSFYSNETGILLSKNGLYIVIERQKCINNTTCQPKGNATDTLGVWVEFLGWAWSTLLLIKMFHYFTYYWKRKNKTPANYTII